jgi:hypothetical protein
MKFRPTHPPNSNRFWNKRFGPTHGQQIAVSGAKKKGLPSQMIT